MDLKSEGMTDMLPVVRPGMPFPVVSLANHGTWVRIRHHFRAQNANNTICVAVSELQAQPIRSLTMASLHGLQRSYVPMDLLHNQHGDEPPPALYGYLAAWRRLSKRGKVRYLW